MTAGSGPTLSRCVQDSLLPGTTEIFQQLSEGDQRHLLAVHALLIDERAREDVLRAGLLHDIGKVYNGQRIGVASRCLKVLMSTVTPGVLASVTQRPMPPWWGAGLWIAGNHARVGAQMLEELGYSARVCWLVAHHEDTGVNDIGLAQLGAADNSQMTVPPR
ncbi:MAG: HD domain-containing protein [Thermomicrobiales bacterium]